MAIVVTQGVGPPQGGEGMERTGGRALALDFSPTRHKATTFVNSFRHFHVPRTFLLRVALEYSAHGDHHHHHHHHYVRLLEVVKRNQHRAVAQYTSLIVD